MGQHGDDAVGPRAQRLREALGAPAFLLESVERGEQVGRHSFLGAGLPTATAG